MKNTESDVQLWLLYLNEQCKAKCNQPNCRDWDGFALRTLYLHSSYVIILPKTNYFIIYNKHFHQTYHKVVWCIGFKKKKKKLFKKKISDKKDTVLTTLRIFLMSGLIEGSWNLKICYTCCYKIAHLENSTVHLWEWVEKAKNYLSIMKIALSGLTEPRNNLEGPWPTPR